MARVLVIDDDTALRELMTMAGFKEVESRRGQDLPYVVARGYKR